jgi:hypothetical protein
MRIKRIKTRSQRITKFRVFEKKFKIKELMPVLVISKNLTKLLGFTKTRKRRARQVFGRLFYFYNLGSEFQDLNRWTDKIWVSKPWQTDIWDLNLKTSIERQTASGFQDLVRQTDEICVSEPRQTDKRDLGFRTSTDKQTDAQTNWINI